MIRISTKSLLISAAYLASMQSALAQNYSLDATYGNVSLTTGFLPDPYTLDMRAGGSINASSLGNGCIGKIADAPDLQLNFEAGDFQLYISAISEADTSLVVNMPSGEWICDDDSGDSLNPSLTLGAVSGVYDIWLGTVNSDALADATLRISELPSVGDSDQPGWELFDSRSLFEGDYQGQLLAGALESGDDERSNGAWQDIYSFTGEAGQYMVADLRSQQVDTFLEVITPSGERYTNDDHEGSTARSLISLTLDESGEYRIVSSSYSASESGDYEIGLELSASNSLSLDNAFSGRLEDGDATRSGGQYVDVYPFSGATGQAVTIDLSSPTLDTVVILESPSGQVVENDDTDTVNHSVLELELSESGPYNVYVTSYDASASGSYELTIAGGISQGSQASQSGDTRNLVLGTSLTGTLSNSDITSDRGSFVDFYSFSGNAGDNVLFDLRSDDLDTFLVVTAPDGTILENDDWEGSTARSVINMTLPASGRYIVGATSYRSGEGGNYEIAALSSTSAGGSSIAGAGSSGGQVYGIFVGISDYSMLRQTQPGWGDLAFTADDAIVARDALIQNAGMPSGNAITLLDSEATVENVTAAFGNLAGRVGPNDTFVFFYSGHGGQEQRSAGPTASDADGYDETLALANATISDDRVSALFDTVSAGTSLIILDSCFSGGFAKDVVSSPGRMGLFSSDEDVPSLVAGKFRAGGYLSHFFREAVENGNADADRNASIDAMELSQFIHMRYSAESQTKGPSNFDTPDFGYQHLVADRGGVAHDTVLFVLP